MVNFPPSLTLNRRNFGNLLRKSGETVLLFDQFYTVQVRDNTAEGCFQFVEFCMQPLPALLTKHSYANTEGMYGLHHVVF